VHELDCYFDRIRPQLRAVPESHDVMAFLRRPPASGWLVVPRLAWTQLSTVAYSLLPRWAQDLYGHRGLPEPTATGLLRVIRRVALTVPDRLRWKACAPRITEAVTRLGDASTPSINQLSAAPEHASTPTAATTAAALLARAARTGPTMPVPCQNLVQAGELRFR
jgi:hypothetical protein